MPGVHWNDCQFGALKAALAEGIPVDKVVIEGKTPHAIRLKAVREGLVPRTVPKVIWETEEKRLLKRLVAQGMKAREIAAQNLLPRFNRNAIQKQIGRLRLANQKQSEAIKKAVPLTRKERAQLLAFIRKHAKTCSSPEIAELWNADHSPKITARKVRGLISRNKIKRDARKIFRSEYCARRRKKAQKSDSARRARSRRWEKYWRRLTSEMASAAQTCILNAAISEKTIELRTCRRCKLQLPAEAPYFVGRKINVPIGTPAPKKSKLCCVCRRRSASRFGKS